VCVCTWYMCVDGAVKVLASLFREAQFSLFAGVTHSAVRKVAIRVVEHLHDLDLQFHLDRQTGGLTRVIDRGTKAMSLFFGSIVFNVVPAIMELGMVIGALSHKVGWKLAVAAMSALSAYSVFTLFLTQWRVRLRQEMNALENKAGAQTVDSLMNYVAVKAFSAEDREISRYDDVMHKYQTASIRFQMSLAALNFGQNLIFALATVGMIGLAAHGIETGKHTVGDAVLVNGLLNQIHRPLNFLGVVYREVKQASVDMENMFSLLDKESCVKDSADAVPFKLPAIPSAGLSLSMEDVSFSYNAARGILKGVSFHAAPGDFIAVVGGNGGGKTTLIRLLSGFLAPENGKIWLGGQDVRKVTSKSIRPYISLVPQDTTLFNHSIRQNIMVGNPKASEEEFRSVVESIGLDKSVSEMPAGWETMVGERGLKLSEGEKQKISIARALLKKSRVLFCDEVCSFS
jgi:ABC-type transport system involved in Fe-S cluster assembly fused permease/ATPase subunit